VPESCRLRRACDREQRKARRVRPSERTESVDRFPEKEGDKPAGGAQDQRQRVVEPEDRRIKDEIAQRAAADRIGRSVTDGAAES
jgi:CobQ-like glutamine amidotransferase family enzyme